jgi:hypothetical protein
MPMAHLKVRDHVVLCCAVLQVYMEAQDYDALLAACIQHGDASAGGDPQLWAEALEYLSTQPGGIKLCNSQPGPVHLRGQPQYA